MLIIQDQNEDEDKASSFQRKWVCTATWFFCTSSKKLNHCYFSQSKCTQLDPDLFYPAPGRGFPPGPSRRRWRGWLRLHRSDPLQRNRITQLKLQYNTFLTPYQHWCFFLGSASYMCVEVRSDAISRRDPEDPVPAGRGVQEERPLWEGAAGSQPHQPGSLQTGTFITQKSTNQICMCHQCMCLCHKHVWVLIIPHLLSEIHRNLGASRQECQTGSTAGSTRPTVLGLHTVLLWGYLHCYMSVKTVRGCTGVAARGQSYSFSCTVSAWGGFFSSCCSLLTSKQIQITFLLVF